MNPLSRRASRLSTRHGSGGGGGGGETFKNPISPNHIVEIGSVEIRKFCPPELRRRLWYSNYPEFRPPIHLDTPRPEFNRSYRMRLPDIIPRGQICSSLIRRVVSVEIRDLILSYTQ